MPALFPAGAIAYAELSGSGEKLEQLRDSEHFAAWLASPQYRRYEASQDYRRLQAGRQIVERQLGRNVWALAKSLLGGNVAVGVYPKEGSEQPDVLGILRTEDPAALADLRRELDPLLVLAAEQFQRTESLAGIETYAFPKDAGFLAWKGNWLAVATSRSLLDGALRKLDNKATGEKSAGLVGDAPYVEMVRATDWDRPGNEEETERLVRVFVDTALVNKATGGKSIPEKLDNPVGSLLFGDVAELLRTSPFAMATMDVGVSGLSINLALARDDEKLDERHRGFVPAEGAGVEPPPRVPDLIGGITLYRDFAHWYSHREDLLQEQVLPGFDKFETGLANLLPGQDFGEDVLPLLGKRIAFVAAPQDYSHLNGKPGVRVPGMALVIELAQPEEGATLLQLLFQTLAAILNLEAGQQGRQPWVVTSETYHDVQVSYAKYLQTPSGKDLGIVFNFLPASARVGNRFVLSSSLPLCKQLIDELLSQPADGSEAGTLPKTLLGELHFESVAAILESNTSFFVGRMAQEGRTTDEAQAEFAALLDFLRRFDSIRAGTEVSPKAFKVRLEGIWK
jgi:hypothetical protein